MAEQRTATNSLYKRTERIQKYFEIICKNDSSFLQGRFHETKVVSVLYTNSDNKSETAIKTPASKKATSEERREQKMPYNSLPSR